MERLRIIGLGCLLPLSVVTVTAQGSQKQAQTFVSLIKSEALRDQGNRYPIRDLPAIYDRVQRGILQMKAGKPSLLGRWSAYCGWSGNTYAGYFFTPNDRRGKVTEFFSAAGYGDFIANDGPGLSGRYQGQFSWDAPGSLVWHINGQRIAYTCRRAGNLLFMLTGNGRIDVLIKE